MDNQNMTILKTQLLLELVDNIPDVIYVKDKGGRLILVNKAHAAGLGLQPHEVIGKTDYDFFPKIQADKMTQDDRQVMQTGKPIIDRIERTTQPNGSHHCVSTTKIPWRDKDGAVIGIMGITRDVSERTRKEELRIAEKMKAEAQLQKLKDKLEFEKQKLEEILKIEEELNSIVQTEKLISFVVEKTTRILKAEKCSLMLTDKNEEELYIRGFKGLNGHAPKGNGLVSDDSVSAYVARTGKPVLVFDIEKDERFGRQNRPGYHTKSFMSVPLRINDRLIGVINVADKSDKDEQIFSETDFKILKTLARQVSVAMENTRLYKQLNYLAISDPLTNMYNYRHFSKSLDDEMRRTRRYGQNLCLLMIDVDNFKEYNDTYGHLEGDDLLKKISRVLKTNLREVDIACRYAGDEFVIILPNTGIAEARIVAEKIKSRVHALPVKMPITLSIGVAAGEDGTDRHGLVLRADSALYSAKRQGRDRICLYQKESSPQRGPA